VQGLIQPTSLAAERAKERLNAVVHHLAAEIGPRNINHYPSLGRAAAYIEAELGHIGYAPFRQSFEAKGKEFSNIVGEKRGAETPDDIFIVGAHYDTHKSSPGANDNGSGLAVLLELARAASQLQFRRTIRFVAFTNEESPFTRTSHMGSLVYARHSNERRENLVGMLCLETLGSYTEEIGSQRLSLGGLLLPRSGNFLALVGNLASRPLLRLCSDALQAEPAVPIRVLSLPGQLPGMRSSDHWSFWKYGYQAVMVTDTAPLRYNHYHRSTDTLDKLNLDWLARVADGLQRVVRSAAGDERDSGRVRAANGQCL
jgi:Zn-dependent M28 family amino/carboxypeptidase